MKTLLAVLVNIAIIVNGYAQGTAFTYQGRLNSGGNPANGSYDFTFTIFGTNYGGSPITPTITNMSVSVNTGLFMSALDFGSFLNGNPAWLEIGVRSHGNGGFTTLIPRQQLTPAPYAIFAHTASNVIGTINGNQIASGSIGASQLAAGAASANLQAGGQGVVPSGGILLSTDPNSTNLAAAGYTRFGGQLDLSSWQQLSSDNAPSPRTGQSAVWTGNEMVVWDGDSGVYIGPGDGGRFNPAANSWSPTTLSNAPANRTGFTAVWTGSKMIIWGGAVYSLNGGPSPSDDGASYDPVTDSWSSISTSNAPSARFQQTAVWSGSEMIIWGGRGSGNICYNTGARYNPTTDTWTPMSTNGAPEARTQHSAVWTGTQMIVWGGITINGSSVTYPTDGGLYNPTTDTWSPMTTSNMPPGRSQSVVWTGTEMIVWDAGTNGFNTSGRYNPITDVWSPISTYNAPSGGTGTAPSAVWTGSEMIVWGGGADLNTGGRYNPITDTWLDVSSTGAPAARDGQTAIWTGNEMIIFGGETSNSIPLNDTFSYTTSQLMYLYLKP